MSNRDKIEKKIYKVFYQEMHGEPENEFCHRCDVRARQIMQLIEPKDDLYYSTYEGQAEEFFGQMKGAQE